MSRTILMGDPRFFSVRGGANPHTRNALGIEKTVDAIRAREQWHAMAKALIARGVEVLVIPPHEDLPGLVYPANAGFLYPLEKSPTDRKTFYLANLLTFSDCVGGQLNHHWQIVRGKAGEIAEHYTTGAADLGPETTAVNTDRFKPTIPTR